MNKQYVLGCEITEQLQQCGTEIDRLLGSGAHQEVAEVLGAIRQTTGKRFRPALCFLAAEFGGGQDRQRLSTIAALIELVHTASLVHDDIVDDSPQRRGRPTVQAQFGKDIAVFTGDLLLARVMEQSLKDGLAEAGLCIAQTISQMCRGELLQKQLAFSPQAREQDYLSVIRGKTGALFSAACYCGAVEGGCDGQTVEQLREFGMQLGILFQLRDDLLDFESSEDKEGKPIHQDFINGVFTLPILYTLQNPQTADQMREAISLLQQDKKQAAAQMEQAVQQAEGLCLTKEYMQGVADRADSLLCTLLPCKARQTLEQVVDLLRP